MAETSARLLLLLSLFQSRRQWPGTVLAERLEVSPRTVRRDIGRLRELGYPVSVTKGPGSAYRLDAGAKIPPLLFDDEQAIAVAVALQTAPSTVAGLGEAAARALTTVRQVMPQRLQQRVDAVRVTSIDNVWDLAAPPVDSQLLLAVGSAVRHREVLRCDYASSHGPGQADGSGPGRAINGPGPGGTAADPELSLRVEPHHLVMWSGRWYLVAWDLARCGWRTFRVDRITRHTSTGHRFIPKELPGEDVTAFVVGQFDRGDTPGQWACHGEVILDAPAAVVARWAPGGAVVAEVPPNRCRLALGAWSWPGLAALIGTFGCDIEVIGPPELTAACEELAHRYAAAAGLPNGPAPPTTAAPLPCI
ncbi:transcriptional regulator [Streptomyces sp. CB02923]|uniref:helix-turn-helix transcriptional regulator n=1 Tax=Streptomyces sp. CB02923 TaxID=1718985 RepID=UPI00093FE9D2|nr:WYL domain-containing protein [Streptomyces sp. CB02923]OKH98890.1 transcriptional regulator [Streptomyces sp. CB02923]